MLTARSALAWCTTRWPIPPRPLLHGSTTASARAVATTASTALPPAASTSAPTPAAVPFCATTTPPRDDALGLRICQFCVACMPDISSADRDRTDPVGIKRVVAGEARDFVVG